MPPKRVAALLKTMQPISLQATMGDDEERSLADSVEDETVEQPYDRIDAGLLKDHLNQLLAGLTERERLVLEQRFGLGDCTPLTLAGRWASNFTRLANGCARSRRRR